jgi:aspartate carbamoyltransferase catalytic subunit
MKSLINITDLSVEELQLLMDKALDIIARPQEYAQSCRGKKIATLFFEPSTRTRLSFEAAMLELGGSVISVSGAGGSSVTKGETLADTARVVSCYADVIAVRHPLAGSARSMAKAATIPVINAGDGGHYHPTQTLADLLTIYREKGRLSGLKIGICGDLLYGRTVHSLIDAMSRYEGVSFTLIAPTELKVPEHITEKLQAEGIPYEETTDLEAVLPDLDLLYMTRIQRERFENPQTYERLAGCYVLDARKMRYAKKDCIVLHPLPRVDEISTDFDSDPRAAYFRQAENGKFMREALILKLLAEKDLPAAEENVYSDPRFVCTSKKCVCTHERGIVHEVYYDSKGALRCAYCDELIEE